MHDGGVLTVAKQKRRAAMKLGRAPVRHDKRTLMFAKYLDPNVVLPQVPRTQSVPSVRTWPMYGNDRLGDCTVASAGHMIQSWTRESRRNLQPLDSDIEFAYWQTGTPPKKKGTAGSGTDDGRVELDVLNYWRNTGIGMWNKDGTAAAPDKIEAYAAVDPQDRLAMKAAIYLFGGVYVGIDLPKTAQKQLTWKVVSGPGSAPGSWGGHAVPLLGYSTDYTTCVTWGQKVRMSWEFNDVYCVEAYAIISKDFLTASGKTADGFDLVQLGYDLAAITK